MTVLVEPIGPLTAARAYLLDELSARGNPLPVGVQPPPGEPVSYALLQLLDTKTRVILTDYAIRVRVFDADTERLEHNTGLAHRLMLHAVHRRVTAAGRTAWITAAAPLAGPSDLDDPDVPLFGRQFTVVWSIGLNPEQPQ